ncbi:hypothetical protein SESBI_36931 [Sesbania bispinosa]|nr:hypothetical protein SESBI_36931 [Sesbania bispinosa]
MRPFCPSPTLGDDFVRDSLMFPIVHRDEALLFHDVPATPTHLVSPSPIAFSCHLRRISMGRYHFCCQVYSQRVLERLVDHVFANDLPFVEVLTKVGIAYVVRLSPRLNVYMRGKELDILLQRWSYVTHTFYASRGEFAPSLDDVHMLMKLPMFGDYDVSGSSMGSHLIEMAKELKAASIDSAKYSREFLSQRHVDPALFKDSLSKTSLCKIKGTGNVLPPHQRKVMKG